MFAEFGYGVLVVTFLVAFYSVVAAIYGAKNKSASLVESARRAMLLTFPLISIAAVSLIYLLVNNHFEVAFVYEVTSSSMPTYLKVTAWWGGQAGSLLFWSFLLSAFASAVTIRKWDRYRIPALGDRGLFHHAHVLPWSGNLLRESIRSLLAGRWKCGAAHVRSFKCDTLYR